MWLWQQQDWPNFTWRQNELQSRLWELQFRLGILLGSSEVSGDEEQALDILLANLIASSAIEDERLNAQSIRSSLAKRLGISDRRPYPVSEKSEGFANMLFDALGADGLDRPLTQARLLGWHHELFAHENRLLGQSIVPGTLRGDALMQVVSGRTDKPTIHFEAPPRAGLEDELKTFIQWFNTSRKDLSIDPLLRAGLAHLWFVTLHPLEDGNGRITRLLTDMALAQADGKTIRCYAMSVTILARRKEYYEALQAAQRGTMDITEWLSWFIDTLAAAVAGAQRKVDRTVAKARFWQINRDQDFRPEQVKVLNRLLDGGDNGFEDGISASKYSAVTGTSRATATRHLAELVERGCLIQGEGGGRSVRYQLAKDDKKR